MKSNNIKNEQGFTLIELSIVLVIIGLIVGGVLVGQDLISAAAVRAQITQFEKYNTAVNTFRGKYNGYLPGDMPDPDATRFGFLGGRTTNCGDGNGVISAAEGSPWGLTSGEALSFWSDLSKAGLIDFQPKNETYIYCAPGNGPTTTATTTPSLSDLFPQAKIGNGNYVFVWEGGYLMALPNSGFGDEQNYYTMGVPTQISNNGTPAMNAGLTVLQASNIDKKVDDGLPQSGKVEAIYIGGYVNYGPSGTGIDWAAGGGNVGAAGWGGSTTTQATAWAATNCYDNANAAGVGVTGPQMYSLAKNANAINCSLSLQFQ